MLQHLERARGVELVVRERQVGAVERAELEVRPLPRLPLRAELGVVEVDPHDTAFSEALGEALRQDTLATADVEHGSRRGLLPQLVERAVEAAHQPLDDRIRGAVLVVCVAGRYRLCDGAGHSFRASRSSPDS